VDRVEQRWGVASPTLVNTSPSGESDSSASLFYFALAIVRRIGERAILLMLDSISRRGVSALEVRLLANCPPIGVRECDLGVNKDAYFAYIYDAQIASAALGLSACFHTLSRASDGPKSGQMPFFRTTPPPLPSFDSISSRIISQYSYDPKSEPASSALPPAMIVIRAIVKTTKS